MPATSGSQQTPPPVLEAVEVSKSFGGVDALRQASFSATRGEVHALVGENGAGKSTLIKILGGRLRPDAGEVRILDQKRELRGVDRAHDLGLWTVFQELTLLPWMTVAENLLIRREPRGAFGLVDHSRMTKEAEAILARFGVENIAARALIEDLSLAKRQIVEIVRVMLHEPEMLLLDEPTSSLGEKEVEWLFGHVRALSARGKCIVFTSHRWNEITDIADRITIFRNGRALGTFVEIEESRAVTLMAGREVSALYPTPPALSEPRPLMEVFRLHGPGIADVSLTLRTGEILGVGGLAGQGHRELFFGLFGAHPIAGGEIRLDERKLRIRTPRDAVAAGVALVPEDRKTEGLLLEMPVGVNLTLAILSKISALGVIRGGRERALARQMVEKLKIRTPGLSAAAGALSGGNQQKVLLARWLLARSRVLLLYDVTRGVDVATKHEIYDLMMRLAAEGRSLLFYSSDAEELSRLCHRVLVMREGRVVAELEAPGVTAESIVSAAVREAQNVD